MPLVALADGLGMDRTTLTRNLAPLQRRRLVASKANPDDERVRLLELSAAGRQLMARAVPLWKKAQTETFKHLDRPAWERVHRALDRLP